MVDGGSPGQRNACPPYRSPGPGFQRLEHRFDQDPIGRERSGVRRSRAFRPIGDEPYVLIDLEFESLAEAERMHDAALELWAR